MIRENLVLKRSHVCPVASDACMIFEHIQHSFCYNFTENYYYYAKSRYFLHEVSEHNSRYFQIVTHNS